MAIIIMVFIKMFALRKLIAKIIQIKVELFSFRVSQGPTYYPFSFGMIIFYYHILITIEGILFRKICL